MDKKTLLIIQEDLDAITARTINISRLLVDQSKTRTVWQDRFLWFAFGAFFMAGLGLL